jgi:hypothetical protein
MSEIGGASDVRSYHPTAAQVATGSIITLGLIDQRRNQPHPFGLEICVGIRAALCRDLPSGPRCRDDVLDHFRLGIGIGIHVRPVSFRQCAFRRLVAASIPCVGP